MSYDARPSNRQIHGTFQIPLLPGAKDQHWSCAYVHPPPIGVTVPITYPLSDFRENVFGSDAQKTTGWAAPRSFLKNYGFTAVKHVTALLDESYRRQAFDDVNVLEEVYYCEIKALVSELTGAKEVFVTNSCIRRTDICQTTASPVSSSNDNWSAERGKQGAVASSTRKSSVKSSCHTPTSSGVLPARIPHLDYTPLGARRAIRYWRKDIFGAANRAGVIAKEDEICAANFVNATDKSSDVIIEKYYNTKENHGPRYAVYSIWRPLRKVTRDPLAMAHRKSFLPNGDLVFFPYEVRVRGEQGLGSDFFQRESAIFKLDQDRAQESTSRARSGQDKSPQWYYLSNQEPDEVLVIKFFDSAALGEDAGEAPGAPHASPDIGADAMRESRESIDVRVIAFW